MNESGAGELWGLVPVSIAVQTNRELHTIPHKQSKLREQYCTRTIHAVHVYTIAIVSGRTCASICLHSLTYSPINAVLGIHSLTYSPNAALSIHSLTHIQS